MMERKLYGPMGFNMMYPFSIGDLRDSAVCLTNYMENSGGGKIPWQDLKYIFGEIMCVLWLQRVVLPVVRRMPRVTLRCKQHLSNVSFHSGNQRLFQPTEFTVSPSEPVCLCFRCKNNVVLLRGVSRLPLGLQGHHAAAHKCLSP